VGDLSEAVERAALDWLLGDVGGEATLDRVRRLLEERGASLDFFDERGEPSVEVRDARRLAGVAALARNREGDRSFLGTDDPRLLAATEPSPPDCALVEALTSARGIPLGTIVLVLRDADRREEVLLGAPALTRLCAALVDGLSADRRSSRARHARNNRLAALLSNLGLAEQLLAEERLERGSPPSERLETVTRAVEHALASARQLAQRDE
jgi:hypothetical protein